MNNISLQASIMSFSLWHLSMPYGSNHSNLQCFPECITPIFPIRLLPNKKSIETSNGFLQTPEKDRFEGFTLSDLWHTFTEWSAYGAGVPIVLNNGDRIVQRRDKINKSSSNSSCLGSNATWDDSTTSQFGSSCTQTTDQCGYLYYQYNEMASPYDRVPLKEKINELAKHYPGLVDLCSSDFSPYSWVAIAWYPVYQVPVARNVKELSACFLTYHPLSSLSQGSKNIMLEKKKVEGKSCSGEDRRSSRRKKFRSLPLQW